LFVSWPQCTQIVIDVLKTRDVFHALRKFGANKILMRLYLYVFLACPTGRFSKRIDLFKKFCCPEGPGAIIAVVIDHLNYFVHKRNEIEEKTLIFLISLPLSFY